MNFLVKWKKQSQALLLIMMFLLIIAPMSTLAETEENENVVYVALGDSLAEGLLSDGKSFSIGYVGNIALDLEKRGYEVFTKNYGVSGFTSSQVLEQLSSVEELPDADIITLSVGANDILPLVNTIPFEKFDPRFMDPDTMQKILHDAAIATQEITDKKQSIVNNINEINTGFTATSSEIEAILTVLKEFDQQLEGLDEVIGDLTAVNEIIKSLLDQLDTIDKSMQLEDETLRTLQEEVSIRMTSVSNKIKDIQFPEENKETKSRIINALDSLTEINKKLANLPENLKEYEEIKIVAEKANELASNAMEVGQALQTFETTLEEVGQNIGAILSIIRSVNPDADIYVMGYYNALPFLDVEITDPLLGGLNQVIQLPTNQFQATFVPTSSFFNNLYDEYLDNQPNIHPNEAGYRALADAFIEKIGAEYPARKVKPPIAPENPHEDENGSPNEDTTDNKDGGENGDENPPPVGDSNDDEDKTNDKDEQVLTVAVDKKDNQLPKTATNNYNLLLIGLLLSSVGLGIHGVARKKQAG